MSSFSNTQLEKKIKVLTMSQQSIQTLSLWCIHHRKHAKTVVQTWFKDFVKVKPKKKLAMMYLTNDILQNSRRKGMEYNKEFAAMLPEIIAVFSKHCDDKMVEGLKRIVTIWAERNVYDLPFINRLLRQFGGSVTEEEVESTTPPLQSMPPIDTQGFTSEDFTVTEYKRPAVRPDPDDLVRRLQELENSATQDAVVREKIANLPTEVTDPTYIDKVEDLESARKLCDKINSACMLLQEYNARLAAEQDDRKVAQRMLTDYMACQKYELALASEKLEEYQNKLEKVTAVKKELQSHLENLPDMSKLPEPIPLPSAGDLFSINIGR